MSIKSKDLKARFNVDDTLKSQPQNISAILSLDFGFVAQIVMTPMNASEPNGVKMIDDNKPKGDREAFKDFVAAQVKVILLQEDEEFIPLLKARMTKSDVACEAHMRPAYIDFFFHDQAKTQLNVNNKIETDDRKSIRDFKYGLESISQPDDWIEFSCKSAGVVYLNRAIKISGLAVDGNRLRITYLSIAEHSTQTIAFDVNDAEQLAQSILEKTTSPKGAASPHTNALEHTPAGA